LISGGASNPTWTTGTLALGTNFITSGVGPLNLVTGGSTTASFSAGTITVADLETNQTFSGTKTFNDINIADTNIGFTGGSNDL